MHNTNCPQKGCYPWGNLDFCKSVCNDTSYCKGFVREKSKNADANANANANQTCTLLKNGNKDSGNFARDIYSDLYTKN